MRTWSIGSAPTGATEVVDTAGRLIDAIGTADFGTALLAAVNTRVAADSLCVYRLSAGRPPRRHCAASHEKADSTGSCWRAYRDGIYLADETFDEVHDRARAASFVLGHLTAAEVRYLPHRRHIYDRHGLLDRLSVASPEPDGDLLALNVYRHRDLGHFGDREIARFEDLSTLLVAAVRRHAMLAHGVDADSTQASRVARYDRMLARFKPTLTERERAVCARLLTGMLYDGIAEDLGIGVPTVKTYRQRAFDRLGIHFRNELLAIALEAQQRHAGDD